MDALDVAFNRFSLLECQDNDTDTAAVPVNARTPARLKLRSPPPPNSCQCGYDYYIVIDFECTCDISSSAPYWPHEIIEVPVVVVNAQSLVVVGEWRTLVRPVWRPVLTEFCTQLTGIAQSDVDAAPTIDAALVQLLEYLSVNGYSHSALPVFDGEWDVNAFLVPELTAKDLVIPTLFSKFCNLRAVFDAHFGRTRRRTRTKRDIAHMLRQFGLTFRGRQHSGIDDARNIARLVCELSRHGSAFIPNAAAVGDSLRLTDSVRAAV